jgi:hypothetical protein
VFPEQITPFHFSVTKRKWGIQVRTFAKIAALIAIGSVLAACGGASSGQSGAIPTQPQSVQSQDGAQSIAQNVQGMSVADANGWRPYYTVIAPSDVSFDALGEPAGTTIPFYTASIKSPLDGKTYTYHIVGTNPHTSKVTTDVSYVPLVARIHFKDGTVLDPSLPGCGDTVSVTDRFYKGPNFVPTPLKSNGISVGTVQINDGDQRAEFWSAVKGSGYHVVFTTSSAPKVIDITAPTGSKTVAGVCAGKSHRIGEIPINAYDSLVHSIASAHATTTQVPVLLSYNVVETEGSLCCVIGYHSAFSRAGGTQVYAVGAYMDPGVFSVPIEDIHAWTHELGELLNDPFINNATPAWGHVGQVTGCQNNLEVGDPLTGTPFLLKYGGFTYHPQELAFFDWFFRTPAEGTGGEYSFEGTFETAQGKCT